MELSRALVVRPGQERYVKRKFWDKVRRTLGKVPFLDHAVAGYYAAVDPATPRHAKATLFAALAYFVLPADVIPDFLAGLGFTDDGAVLMMALQALAPYVTRAHLEKAKATLAAEAARQG
jgi:uncharacterized membrane protein YkvA (DUF1232 family)